MLYTPDASNYKEILPGVFMKPLTHGSKTLLCEFRLKMGAKIPEHQHPQEQTGYLVSGALRLFGDDGEAIVEFGHSWNFKGGISHGAEALEDSVVIEVFSPLRNDYLP